MYGSLLKKLLKQWTRRKFVFLLLAGLAGTRSSATLAQSRSEAQPVRDRINSQIMSSQQIIEQFPEFLRYSPYKVRETNKIHAYATKNQLREGSLDSRTMMFLQKRAFNMGLQGIRISALPDVDSGGLMEGE